MPSLYSQVYYTQTASYRANRVPFSFVICRGVGFWPNAEWAVGKAWYLSG